MQGFFGPFPGVLAIGPSSTIAVWNTELLDLASAAQESGILGSLDGANIALGSSTLTPNFVGGAPSITMLGSDR